MTVLNSVVRSQGVRKAGRPVTRHPAQLLSASQQAVRKLADAKREQELENSRLSRLNESDLKNLLRWFYDGSLEKWDNEDVMPTKMTSRIRAFFAKTTGAALAQKTNYTLMAEIIGVLATERVQLGTLSYDGWHLHCLKDWAGIINSYDEEFNDLPPVKVAQIRAAYRRYARLVRDIILNSK